MASVALRTPLAQLLLHSKLLCTVMAFYHMAVWVHRAPECDLVCICVSIYVFSAWHWKTFALLRLSQAQLLLKH